MMQGGFSVKKKYMAITLAVIGAILVCLSVVLAYNAMNDIHIIGGADWPMFRHVFSLRYYSMAVLGFTSIIAAIIIGCKSNGLKNAAILIAPLLLFPILRDLYQWIDMEYIVEWFGCGCHAGFNANHFTRLFWLLIAAITTAISVVLSKRIPRSRMWLRIVYVVAMCTEALLIAYRYYQMMMWN